MARRLPPELLLRLNKLFPLLASDKGGEAQATAAALTRILKVEGYDWFDYVESRQDAAPPLQPPRQPRRQPAPWEDEDYVEAVDSDTMLELIEQIARRHPRLNQTSHDFLAGRREKATLYPSVFFSPAQWKWFADLAQQARVSLDDVQA